MPPPASRWQGGTAPSEWALVPKPPPSIWKTSRRRNRSLQLARITDAQRRALAAFEDPPAEAAAFQLARDLDEVWNDLLARA